MKRNARIVTTLACAGALSAGCLVKETRAAIYLEAGGGATWIVHEQAVRSNIEKAKDRAKEEEEFIAAAREERQPIALAFWRLAPLSVQTAIVRGTRPFTVVTEARFDRFDGLMERFARALGDIATSTIERRGAETTWTLTLTDDNSPDTRSDDDKQVDALADALDDLRIVCTACRFVGAAGFTIEGDGTVATLKVDDPPKDGPQVIRLSLTWRER